MPEEPIIQHIANTWSKPLNGLSGRLRVEFEDLKPGLRHALFLELRNYSFNPVAVMNQPQVHADLLDSAGKPVSTLDFSSNGPNSIPQWAVIPRDAYLGFRIDMQTTGVPTREQGMVLLAVGGKSWGLTAGEYVLKTTVEFKKEERAPQNAWVGEFELPPVNITVTPQMLAAN